jgi:hypothetical protein
MPVLLIYPVESGAGILRGAIMRTFSTEIVYVTQIICIFGTLSVGLFWGMGLEGNYEIYTLVSAVIFITAALYGRCTKAEK